MFLEILDPLEQFQNQSLANQACDSFLNVITANWTLIWTLSFLNIVLTITLKTWNFTWIDWVANILFDVVKNILVSSIKTFKNSSYYNFVYICQIILSVNLVGLIPYSWTLSSWFIIILYFSMAYLFYINIHSILNKTWTIFCILLPQGTPLILSPFLLLVEVISYGSRVVSLSVRLFANMLSGHSLLKILISFSWKLLWKITAITYLVAILIWSCVSIILILECLVAMLQAYVFTLLLVIYWSDAWIEGH